MSRPYWDRLIGSDPAAAAEDWAAYAEALRAAIALRPSLHGRDYVGDPDQYSADLAEALAEAKALIQAVERADLMSWRWSDRWDAYREGDPGEAGPSIADERRWDADDDIARGGSGGPE